MEVDITEKVKRGLRFGLAGILVLAFLCVAVAWGIQAGNKSMSLYDAKVACNMVGARVLAPGKIQEMLAEDGEHVEAGQPIARVEVSVTEDQLAQLQQTVDLARQNLAQVRQGQTVTVPVPGAGSAGNPAAQAALVRAEERMHRMNELFEMGAISALQRDAAAADYRAAQAAAASAPAAGGASYRTIVQPSPPEVIQSAELALQQAEAALKTAQQDAQATEVAAPVAGTVYYTDVKEGSEVRPGQPVAQIGDNSRIWVEARATMEQKERLHLGQAAAYELDGREWTGTIVEIETRLKEEAGAPETATEGQEEADLPDSEMAIIRISLPSEAAQLCRPGTPTTVKVRLAEG